MTGRCTMPDTGRRTRVVSNTTINSIRIRTGTFDVPVRHSGKFSTLRHSQKTAGVSE